MRLHLISILLLSVFCFARSFAQNTYYVDAGAKAATANGTYSNPFNSVDQVNKLLLRSGDAVLFKSGLVFAGTFIPKTAAGAEKIRIGTYGGKKEATIRSGHSEGIIIKGANSITVSNFKIEGAGRKTGNTTHGLVLDSCFNVRLSSNMSSGFQKAGIHVTNCSFVDIDSCTAFDNGFAGIELYGSDASMPNHHINVRLCKAYNNAGDPTNLTNHSGNGIIAGFSRNVLITQCVAYNNGWDMPRIGNGPVGIWGYQCDSLEISYCLSYDNKTPAGAKDGGGFDLDGGITHSSVHHCLSYNNHGAAIGIFQYASASAWFDNRVYSNVSINDGNTTPGSASVLIWNNDEYFENFRDLIFYDNVIINDTGALLGYDPDSRHGKFELFKNRFYSSRPLFFGNPGRDSLYGNTFFTPRPLVWRNNPDSMQIINRMRNEYRNKDYKNAIRKMMEIRNVEAMLKLKPWDRL